MNTRDLLHKHNLVRTSCRQSIIETMLNEGKAVSEDEIKNKVGAVYDRTTFYRTFKTLINSGIIHKIVVDNQLVRYAISEPDGENEDHIHFYCNKCGKVECIEGNEFPEPLLPMGYKAIHSELIIKGYCYLCNRD